MAQTKNTVEIVNKIEIGGQPEVLFDSILDTEKKRIVLLMNERVMNPIGYRRKSD